LCKKNVRITICICTYKRPEGLFRLLKALNELRFRKCSLPVLEAIVVDNQGDERIREICARRYCPLEIPIQYETEAKRGISFARNRALASVPSDTDFVVFIDDDEIPTHFWLDELLWVQQGYVADVVGGPVVKMLQPASPGWLKQLFETVNFETGQEIVDASTNNVLIRHEILKRMKIVFDDRFALSGGGDVYFFGMIHKAGYKLVWSRDAIVYEAVALRRANLKWALLRRYRCGNVRMRITLDEKRNVLTRLYSFCRLGGCILWSSAGLMFDIFFGLNRIILRLGWIAQMLGGLAGVLGIKYFEYAYENDDPDALLD